LLRFCGDEIGNVAGCEEEFAIQCFNKCLISTILSWISSFGEFLKSFAAFLCNFRTSFFKPDDSDRSRSELDIESRLELESKLVQELELWLGAEFSNRLFNELRSFEFSFRILIIVCKSFPSMRFCEALPPWEDSSCYVRMP